MKKQPEALLVFSCPSSHGLPKQERMGSPHIMTIHCFTSSVESISKHLQGMDSQHEMKKFI
jgi:hypothetical protein